MSPQTAEQPLPLWEIELRLMELVSEQQELPREQIHRESRLIEDLHIDSLDLVELVLAVEEMFHVTIPEDFSRLPFVTGSVTIGHLAAVVRHQWGTGEAERKAWLAPKSRPRTVFVAPFTQRGGKLSAKAAKREPLLESLAPTEQGAPQFLRCTDGMRCVQIPAAEVELGARGCCDLPDQLPPHRARVSSFLIDAEPVSAVAYSRFLNSTEPSKEILLGWCGTTPEDRRGANFQLRRDRSGWRPIPGAESQPMVLVSWFGANAYALWANGADWRRYDTDNGSFLPSEAQWEYAARGAQWQRFPWGDEPCTPARALVELHTARRSYPALLPLAEVNTALGVSPFGLRHMAGNVWNWCRDWYAPGFYTCPGATADDPCNAQPTGIRSERGGSWIGPGALAASSYRRGRPPQARGRCLGFRCVSHPRSDIPRGAGV